MKKNFLRILSIVLCLAVFSTSFAFTAFAEEANADAAPFRISVTMNGDASTQRGFCWFTKTNVESKVEVFNALGIPVDATVNYEDVIEWDGNFCHQAVVSGLEAGKIYTFRVGDGTTFSDYGTFVTDNGDDKFDFIAIADVQASSEENFEKASKVLEAARATLPTAEFIVNLGDFTNDSTNEEWDAYDKYFSRFNTTSTLVPISGNHDGLGVENWFNNMFCLDTSESVQVKDGVNYSFDYGNAHIAVLNTNDLLAMSNAQLTWLKNDMNGTDKDWKIVFMHKSPYSLGKDGKWPDALYLQKSLAKTLDKCDVDIVMSGHDHMYLRTKALENNKLSEDGTVYVLAGTAGTKRYEIRSFLADHYLDTDFIAAMTVQKHGYANYWNGTDWSETKETNVGGAFNCVSINGGTLSVTAYVLADEPDANGNPVITAIDTYSITKETGKNEITFTGDNTTSEIEYILGVVPSFLRLAAYAFGEWLPKFLIMLPDLLDVVINEGTF